MIHLLSLSVLGGLSLLGMQRPKRPRLVETLSDRDVALSGRHPVQHPAQKSTQILSVRPEIVSPESNLAFSLGILGLTQVSKLAVPSLRLLSLPGLLYLDFYFLRVAVQEWQAERRLGMAICDAVVATGLLFTRQWGADALFASLFFTSLTLQSKAEKRLAHYVAATAQEIQDSTTGDATDPAIDPEVLAADARLALVTELETDGSYLTREKHLWQTQMDDGVLPLLMLSAVSVPLLGINRALAVLLANFGNDYRVTVPLSTVSYLDAAKKEGIGIRDAAAFEKLLRMDTLVLHSDSPEIDSVHWHTHWQQKNAKNTAIEVIAVGTDLTDVGMAEFITQLQAEGRVVGYYGSRASYKGEGDGGAVMQADIIMMPEETESSLVTSPQSGFAFSDAVTIDVLLADSSPERLQQGLQLISAAQANRKRSLYLALAPSIINLTGIYFFRFGPIVALMVDYGGIVAGTVNALVPRWRRDRPMQ